MSHLRFTPAEYKAIARCRCRLDHRTDTSAFRLVLWVSLIDDMPDLAKRIFSLRDDEIRLVRDHLRADAGEPFTPEERRAIVEACRTLPATPRFARPVQAVLVKHFRKASPSLARKLGRMSVTKFVQVFEQVRGV